MQLILLGPPGSGKGTQARLLCDKLGLAHFATGDILREAVRLGTPTGLKAKDFMDKGQYVPDLVVNQIVAERLSQQQHKTGFVMDGYPRTLAQAQALDSALVLPLDAVILLNVSDDAIVLRVSGRRVCPKDGSSYHILHSPPKHPDQCDLCGARLEMRADDPEGTVRERLRIFQQTMPPVIAWYRGRGILREVNGEGSIENIAAAILNRLGSWPLMHKSLVPQKPELKSDADIAQMRETGKVVAEALRTARRMAVPGTKTVDIDKAISDVFATHQVQPLFKNYPGKVPFPAVTCISLNEQVVHGIPGGRVLRSGDLLKIDTACKLNGWCADAAVCLPIGEVSAEVRRLVRVAEESLEIAIRELARKKYWSEVATTMERHIRMSGFSVVEQFVGHGIGRTMHEAPQVPNYSNRESKKHDCPLQPGLVLAIEPMVNMGRKDVLELPDHWTVITRDRLPSAHVEHTVAITTTGVQVLTGD